MQQQTQAHLVAEEVIALVVLCRQTSGQELVHLCLMLWRHAVPYFRSPIVQVIDTMQVSILCMPGQHTLGVSQESWKGLCAMSWVVYEKLY